MSRAPIDHASTRTAPLRGCAVGALRRRNRGRYDGTVLIFDVRDKVNRPIFQSTVKTGKHSDPVWQAAPSLSAHPPGTYHSHPRPPAHFPLQQAHAAAAGST